MELFVKVIKSNEFSMGDRKYMVFIYELLKNFSVLNHRRRKALNGKGRWLQ